MSDTAGDPRSDLHRLNSGTAPPDRAFPAQAEPTAPSGPAPGPSAIIAGLQRAHDEAARVTKERWNRTGDWRVSIPARPDYDSDLIICDAIRTAIKYIELLHSTEERQQ